MEIYFNLSMCQAEIGSSILDELGNYILSEGYSLKSVARCLSLVACIPSSRGEKKEVHKSYSVNSIAL